MALRVVRLGSPRDPGEGLRLGTVRHPPRGVPKDAWGARDFFDVWLPELAPSAGLLGWMRVEPPTAVLWKQFARRYRTEMKEPAPRHLLALVACLSHTTDLAVGCYCEDLARCHRSLLADLLVRAGAAMHSLR